MRFEQLRAFFDQNRIYAWEPAPKAKTQIRIVEFRTAKEYEAVKLRPTADAYYSSMGDRNYIVMPVDASNGFSTASHEYSHFVLRSGMMKLPLWLNEGLAELFSTVTITNGQCELGGGLRARTETLRRNAWLPAAELWATERIAQQTRDRAAVFYAESWAVTDMLTSAPEYAPRFGDLVKIFDSDTDTNSALTMVYGKSPESILADARKWLRRGASPRRKLVPLITSALAVEVSRIGELQARALIADLLLTNGEGERARQILEELLAESPSDPDLLASLGTVALRKDDSQQALEYWQRAVDAGLQDSALCYRYALLADRMNASPEQIELVLERTLTLRPELDDARFRLAQLKSNRGDYAAALFHLQAMKNVAANRAFAYWTAVAYAHTELGNRKEAESAAEQARLHSANAAEHARAANLAYITQTDVSVRFTRDAKGKLQLATTRIPHGTTDGNPFIEEQDHIRVASGSLEEVQCKDGKLAAFLIASSEGMLQLSVSDPTHILIKNSSGEFTCGPQHSLRVRAEYATTANDNFGLLRSLEF